MRYLFAILIVVSLSLTSFNFVFAEVSYENNSQNHTNTFIVENLKIEDELDTDFLNIQSSPKSLGVSENNPHGGSWLDTFEDDSGIDWGLSDHIMPIEGNVKINISDFDQNTAALWHFNEGSGLTTYDATNNNNDGDVINAIWSIGKFYNTLYYDGTGDDRVEINDSNSLDLTNTFTIQAWVYRNESGVRDMIIAKEQAWTLEIESNDIIRLNMFDGSNNFYNSNSRIPAQTWVHVAFSVDGSNVRIYINGSLDAVRSQTSTCNTNSNIVEIGRFYFLALNWIFKGRIDELRISNIARNTQEIRDIYNNGTYSGNRQGNLTSKPIDLPLNMNWDTLIINNTQFPNTNINFTILNASDSQPIPNSPKYNENGEFDISYIDPVKYPSIKLNATFYGDGSSTPILHYWGVSWNSTFAWRDTFFGGLKSQPDNLTNGEGEIWLAPSITDWFKFPNNPILKNGTGSDWDVNGIKNPSIYYNGTGYMMWYSGKNSNNKWQIGLATSSDAINWIKYSGNPVLLKGGTGAWDEDDAMAPKVLVENGIYKMWYMGEDTTFSHHQTGYATSLDGITWTKHPNNPVLVVGAASSWDDHYADSSCIIKDSTIYKMWYTGLSYATSNRPNQIGYATSYDGIDWTKYPSNPVISHATGYYTGKLGLHVLPDHHTYHGWYFLNTGSTVNINYVTSKDGINWVNFPGNPVLEKGPTNAWDDANVVYPVVIMSDKQYYMYYTGSDGSKPQLGLAKSKFANNGTLTSNKISIPDISYYNSLLINKTEPAGTYINITILDGDTQLPIKNFKDISENSIDISNISPLDHPTLILRANINSTTYVTPLLYDWSINWSLNNGPRILDVTSLLKVNRTFSVPIHINLTDKEEIEENLTLAVEYKSPSDVTWQTNFLSDLEYENNKWSCDFTPGLNAVLGDYQFRFTCNDSFQFIDEYSTPYYIEVMNNEPIIWELKTGTFANYVNRTHTLDILINATDIEKLSSQLTMKVNYKSPLDIDWKSIPSMIFIDGYWIAKFNPLKTADLGNYDFNISCNDSDIEIYREMKIDVINNLPSTPQLLLMPGIAFTTDDINILATGSKDAEAGIVEYWYHWFKDGSQIPLLDNSTSIPSNNTTKNEHWRCVVYPFDGDELGTPNDASVTIKNSGPVIIEEFTSFKMYEDTPTILANKLNSIFSDPDNDPLTFNVIGEVNITVDITQFNGTIELTPKKDWFGIETLTFSATDDEFNRTELIVVINVQPTNDLPKITKIGSQIITGEPPKMEFIVKQNLWLNLTIGVSDIDGDVERGMINYIMNITERTNLYFKKSGNELAFNPTNADVGMHYLTVRITDNNETPPIFISQVIHIQVLNVNDPPTASILQPSNNKKFVDAKQIILDCEADDIDFLIPDPNEELSYKWESNITGQRILGFDKRLELANETLPKPGRYYIRLTVTDKAGLNASETINIIVQKTPKERETGESGYGDYYMLAMIIIILIILLIIAILIIITSQRKKREHEVAIGVVAPPQEVLQPVESYRPEPEPATIGAPTPTAGTISAPIAAEGLAGAAIAPSTIAPKPTAAIEPTHAPQLPPTQPQAMPQPQAQTEAEKTEELSPQEKIKLLEERLLRGEISEETYLNLKDKIEFEAKPFEPSPQLPPATVATSIEPEPTTPIPETPQTTMEPSLETPQVTETPPDTTQPEPSIPSGLPPDAYEQTEETQIQPNEQLQVQQPKQQHIEQQQIEQQPEPSPEQKTKEKSKTEEEQQ